MLVQKIRSNRGASEVAQRYRDFGIECSTQPNSGADARWPGDGKSVVDCWEFKTSKEKNADGEPLVYIKKKDIDQIVREAASQNLPWALHHRCYQQRIVWTACPIQTRWEGIYDVLPLTREGNLRLPYSRLWCGTTFIVDETYMLMSLTKYLNIKALEVVNAGAL